MYMAKMMVLGKWNFGIEIFEIDIERGGDENGYVFRREDYQGIKTERS